MKVKLTFIFDTDGGEYEMTVNNLSHPGQGIPLDIIQKAVMKITEDTKQKITGLPEVDSSQIRGDN